MPDDAGGAIQPKRQASDQLKRIDDALRRLETGQFGHCLYCGDPISVARLDHDPTSESCGACDED
ncbi:TraR/DksA family transcriptional regulator [Henriciella aquimarina]|uniref:TraR/DksA family transcriptional regulator n=1 Tax=Henriciella aquimarina TaxID=545261 RepID=UPI0009FBC0C4|nr:hypothetical protein [Henriciella aquimarina]